MLTFDGEHVPIAPPGLSTHPRIDTNCMLCLTHATKNVPCSTPSSYGRGPMSKRLRARQPPYSVRPIPSRFPAHVAGGKGVIISGRWFAPTHTITERQHYKPPPPPPHVYVCVMYVPSFFPMYADVL